jgi:glyoxylase-like metal-dependent hydrolase (beta-lactamase superfamily II)
MQVKEQVVLFDLDTEILPGIQSISTPWHTPGHSAFLFTSGNDTLLAAGDALSNIAFSIENPWILLASDLPPAAAPPGRYKLLDRVVQERWLVSAMHGTFPGLGYVTPDQGTRFHFHELRWTPAPRAVAVCPA